MFLDRDGVLNAALVREGRPYAPTSFRELEILPGVSAALAELKRAGFLLLGVTNQPDVARGAATQAQVEEIHRALLDALPLDGIYTCWHDDADACACRKPAPGLILEGAREHEVDLGLSFMVGDRWRDTEAGARAGCRVVFIDHAWRERRPERYDARVVSLPEAAAWILSGGSR